MNDDSIAHAEAILRADCGERLRSAFPLAPLTSFRIGGPAALYLEPGSDDDLKAAGLLDDTPEILPASSASFAE